MLRKTIKKLIRMAGFEVSRYKHTPQARSLRLFSHYNINLVFDVGANDGQYAKRLRQAGYKGRIVSFEPLSSVYKNLANSAKRDSLWQTCNIALADFDGTNEINISRNLYSSSFLPIGQTHVQCAPESVYVGKEQVIVRRIDSVIGDYYLPGETLFLKIDSQGYEKKIIEGANLSLNKLKGIQMEVSLVLLYDGETLLTEMIGLMSDKGYVLMDIEPGFYNPHTGQLLQVDCIFFRK
jgi:FkbM family methyltransferase